MTQPAEQALQPATREVVRLQGIGVRFGAVRVLRGVDLTLRAGEITALLGTNGAGKSTLIGVLSGAQGPESGEVTVFGEPVRITSPSAARRLGIETVHQRIADGIVPELSVADNVLLTDYARHGRRLWRRARARAEARAALARLGIEWPDEVLDAEAGRLGASDAQLLILSRALRASPRVLILDEPTSALTAAEADRLFERLRRLRDEGLAIVFVSHRFGEIERLADRVVVLREGALVCDEARPFPWRDVLEAMLGVPAELQAHISEPLPAGEVSLEVEGARLLPSAPELSLTLHSGQVTGVLGLLGAGRTELAQHIAVDAGPAGGRMRLQGATYAPRSVRQGIALGVALVPEDRQRDAIQPGWSIARTVGLPVLRELSTVFGAVNARRERARGVAVIDALGVVATGPDAVVDELSGGNQQKVVVGRWLATAPTLLLLDEPFRGVDIAARRVIGEAARAQARDGATVIVLSSDVDEILEVADRIVVLVAGRLVSDSPAGARSRTEIVDALLDDANHDHHQELR